MPRTNQTVAPSFGWAMAIMLSFTVADYDGVNSQQMVLYISTEEAATVTVSVNSTSWSQTINIPAGSVNTSILLPKTGADDCRILNEGIFDRAIHIVSDKPIVVYAHQYNTQLSGATMLLPVETYGYTYYSVNFKQPPVGNDWGKNWFYVIASEDNTRLQITAIGYYRRRLAAGANHYRKFKQRATVQCVWQSKP